MPQAQTMPQYNQLSLRDTVGRAQTDNQNYMLNNQGIQQNEQLIARGDRDAKTAERELNREDMLWLAGASGYVMQNEGRGASELLSEGKRRGIRGFANITEQDSTPELWQAIYDEALVGLGGTRQQRYDLGNGSEGATSRERNYNAYTALPDDAARANWSAANAVPKIEQIAGVPTPVVGGVPQAPLSTIEQEADAAQRMAQAREAGTREGKPSDAQTVIDKEFAKEYAAFSFGGFTDAEKGVSQLRDVQTQLSAGTQNLTGWQVASQPDIMLAQTNPEALNAREQVEEVVQRNLRLILGAQFTEKEGVRLIARAYNPWLDEKYNLIRINRLLKQMEDGLSAKIGAARYYEQNGTLAGYTTPMLSIEDLHKSLDNQKLSPGDTYKGKTYIGGNPKDKNSWTQQ